ncbi:hypothetical protein [Streptomyces sp. MST-110588]|uniref:hypothetical protein n=1 Tax=Streptomyces sp. MST-110588 TaxID=2833628 RepID=UPI001F5C8EC2|nr:hypothetical protein [Streptomyces sp. MST-110588]UNO41778.1 hypothetical protein KGS77_22320 [Streptomyces sp. MST-110588]
MTDLLGCADPKPAGRRQLSILAGALIAWATRRPLGENGEGVTLVRHSSNFRQMVAVLTFSEIPLAFLVSSILPPHLRWGHAVLEALVILTGFGVLAALARHPHVVSRSKVLLRTGFLGSVTLPRQSVRSASRGIRTIEGRGLRRVPGAPAELVCAVGSSVNVRINLDPPVSVDLGDGEPFEVTAIHISADVPEQLFKALRAERAPEE